MRIEITQKGTNNRKLVRKVVKEKAQAKGKNESCKDITSDSSGQRELPKAARPRGVVLYNLVSSFHSRNFLWHNHLRESCADLTTS